MKDLPVYFFEGFLDGGKTSYIRRLINSDDFPREMKLLYLLCEEGEEEPELKEDRGVYVERISSLDGVTPKYLRSLEKKSGCNAVMVEYNGMWMTADLVLKMPPHWIGVRKFVIADAGSFVSYCANMRALASDKLKDCSAVVFNRVSDSTDRLALHRLVRSFSRLTDIFFELEDGTEVPDDLPDELPYDLDADIVEIEDRDYAEFERDLSEEPEKYNGKTVRLRGFAVKGSDTRPGRFDFGRQVMTCCEADITFLAFPAVCPPEKEPRSGSWLDLTATVTVGEIRGAKIPVLMMLSADKLPVPANTLATFY
ncbi:MAG: outer membrane insertion C- signal [Oscillospiraceae bacterium]|nr:outer membrane insertion C- signal [Oscillospiraceae bacterium]